MRNAIPVLPSSRPWPSKSWLTDGGSSLFAKAVRYPIASPSE